MGLAQVFNSLGRRSRSERLRPKAIASKPREHGIDLPSFLLAFASALLGAKLLGEVAERLGQPAVLGELLAGVLLGPSVLGLVTLTAGAFMLAEIGVILLLFEVGLETDLFDLARVGAPALVVALAGMVLPFLGGFLFTRLLGHPVLTAIFVGAALTATSIGITARVLSELKVLTSREGRIILGAAVADDVLGLVVLAVVARIAETGRVETAMVLRATALSVGFVVVAIALGIPLGHRLIGIVGRANVRGSLVAASVAFALLAAVAAKKAGSAEIVGAFATGVVLARTNRRHDMSEALKPAVDIFAPLFFVVVGAQVDVALLNPFARENQPALLLALGLMLVGFLGKFAAGFCAWGRVRRAFIGAGMVPRGEVGLIFASLGKVTGAFAEGVFVAVVLAVFATTFLAPPLLKAFRRGVGSAGGTPSPVAGT
ncbi:MAG TPA: cation:proton antiporter [Thermoanaerobaculia bacterium]|nr:cation:proton antiporter [Thermoanaerobaculia bacterium]